MSYPLFDHRLRAMRRDRAARGGVEPFLYERAFADCLERLQAIRRPFTNVLLAGCPITDWPVRLPGKTVTVIDPGPIMAGRAGGTVADLETLPFESESFDLVIAIGMLETANSLPLAAAAMHLVLRPGGLVIGASIGGESFPRLRQAMLAADAATGSATPRVHPRIEAPALAGLLAESGFEMPVVDVDRVAASYRSLDDMVGDLRAMGATNILASRSKRPLRQSALSQARRLFLEAGAPAIERIEILHFAAWKPA